MHSDDVRTIPEIAQSLFCLGQLNRISIEPNQPSARRDLLEQRASVPAKPKRAIGHDISRLRRKDFENLANHNRSVRPRRSFAGFEHLGDSIAITFRIMLLIFLLEPTRMFAGITWSALMFNWCWLLFSHALKVRLRAKC